MIGARRPTGGRRAFASLASLRYTSPRSMGRRIGTRPERAGRPRRLFLAILGIAAVAVFLRAWRLAWGLADGESFSDESIWVHRCGAFLPLGWRSFTNTYPSFLYPTLYGYLAGSTVWLGHALGARMGPLDIVLVARAIGAMADVAAVGLTGVLGTRLYGLGAGLVAAACMAVVPIAVMQVHYASVDPLLTLMTALTLLAAWQVTRSASPVRTALSAGVAAGLGFATKYTGLALLPVVGWAIAERSLTDGARKTPLALASAAVAGFAAAVLVGCPPCFLHADEMLRAVRLQASIGPHFPNSHPAASLGWYGRPYLYQLVATFPFTLGWPLYALALVGVVLAVRRHQPADRLLLALVLPYFVFLGWAPSHFPRYVLPLVPALVVLAGRALIELPRVRGASAALFAAIWLYTLALAASQVGRFSFDQQHAVARWIAQHVPRGPDGVVRVAAPTFPPDAFLHVVPALEREGLTFQPVRSWTEDRPDAFVLPEWYEVALSRDRAGSAEQQALATFTAGTTGYRAAARWPASWFLQRSFYTWLDPAFGGDLWQGEIGFTVYVRALPAR